MAVRNQVLLSLARVGATLAISLMLIFLYPLPFDQALLISFIINLYSFIILYQRRKGWLQKSAYVYLFFITDTLIIFGLTMNTNPLGLLNLFYLLELLAVSWFYGVKKAGVIFFLQVLLHLLGDIIVFDGQSNHGLYYALLKDAFFMLMIIILGIAWNKEKRSNVKLVNSLADQVLRTKNIIVTTELINKTEEIPEIRQIIYNITLANLEIDASIFLVYDPVEYDFKVAAVQGLKHEMVRELKTEDSLAMLKELTCQKDFISSREGEEWASDLWKKFVWLWPRLTEAYGLCGGYNVRWQEKLFGVVLCWATDINCLEPYWFDLGRKVVNRTAFALAQLESVAEQITPKKEIAASSLISQTERFNELPQVLAALMARHFYADICIIGLFDQQQQDLLVSGVFGSFPLAHGERLEADDFVTNAVVREGIIVHKTARMGAPLVFQGEAIVEVLSVPITSWGKNDGLIAVMNKTVKKQEFTDGDRRMATFIANQLGLSMENNNLYNMLRDTFLNGLDSSGYEEEENLYIELGMVPPMYKDVMTAVTQGKLILSNEQEITKIKNRNKSLVRLTIKEKTDVALARHEVRRLLEDLGVPANEKNRLLLCASEVITNMVKHADGGDFEIYLDGETLCMVAKDQGPGMSLRDIPKATLVKGFSTKKSMGFGFTILLDLLNKVYLQTNSKGTTIVMEHKLSH